jgi:hypothetical protein
MAHFSVGEHTRLASAIAPMISSPPASHQQVEGKKHHSSTNLLRAKDDNDHQWK